MKASKSFLHRAVVPFVPNLYFFSGRPAILVALLFLPVLLPATLVTKTDNVPGSVDGGTVNKVFNFSVADFGGSPPVTKVTATIDFFNTNTSCPNIGAFGFNEEMSFWVLSPAGTKVVLTYDAYNSHGRGLSVLPTYNGFGCVRAVVTFDDAAATAIGGGDPVSGTFRPEEALSTFNGESAVGNWTVVLADGTAGFPTCFFSVSLSVDGTALPVSELEFDVRQRRNDLELNWLVQEENGVSSYEVERAIGNSAFRKLGGKPATGGGRYAYVDEQGGWTAGQVLGYRLVEVQEDGQRVVLDTRWVTFKPETHSLKVWPNPANEVLWLEAGPEEKLPSQIHLFSLQGKRVRSFEVQDKLSRQALSLSGLSPGLYFLSAGTQKFRIAVR